MFYVSIVKQCRGIAKASSRLLCFALWVLACLLGSTSHAFGQPASWSDPALPVKEALSLWLDATHINKARAHVGLSALEEGGPLEEWLDASAAHRNFLQSSALNQPKLVKLGDAWSVRFDGENDHLRCIDVPGTCEDATIFLVASPHENQGDFRGFFAANSHDRRDYESGFTIDLGPNPTRTFDQLNVEGQGFGGFRDLHSQSSPFGTLQTIEATINSQTKQVALTVNGKGGESRPLQPGSRSLNELTLAARFYTNGPGAQQVRGNLKCDIVELLFYDRVLVESERLQVRSYLAEKYRNLSNELPLQLKLESIGEPLVKVENPPAIQMLSPGFEVYELPIELPNVNNVRYREDGKLVALGYNGDIHLLSDTDGDGLEDSAKAFWKNTGSLRGPIGLQLTPPSYAHGRGAFVPSKGKVSLIVDKDADDVADEEIVIAKGWQEITQNVDAVGIAMAPDGSVYFGLGTENYANAYLVDEAGKASYKKESERGTVQRILPDLKSRETVCTGIRFPIAFAFNREGDLFCTEQEGATWLANGNPFDELLHIRPDRHYGFPPRHPRYNPEVIDEPSTFDYGPQHQSTCGMVFNGPVNGGPIFGPNQWDANAIVCGESRGKLWRTQLVKSKFGYVAASQLIACLQMLTIDACVAPNGDLVVACHSGPPDWGTGPTGIGKLFRIKMVDASAPRPTMTWMESPNEIRIAFDRPLDPLKLRSLTEGIRVEYGPYVKAGDRFEHLAPPYAVVHRQSNSPRKTAVVASTSVTNDLRTMIIYTSKLNTNTSYAVTLPSYESNQAEEGEPSVRKVSSQRAIDQHPQIDIDGSGNGLMAYWKSSDPNEPRELSTWIPHVDLVVSKALTHGSAGHDEFWAAVQQPGVLRLTGKLDLHSMLRPAVQPGSSLDYEWPPEKVTVRFRSTESIQFNSVAISRPEKLSVDDKSHLLFDYSGEATEWVDFEVRVATRANQFPDLSITTFTNEDSRDRPVPLRRFMMPWLRPETLDGNEPKPAETIVELEGGSWGRGRRVFHSEAAGCFKCHAIGSAGTKIGPDLSNLIHRDYASVVRDIVNPSYAINPDYIGHIIALTDGQTLTGVLRDEQGELLLGDNQGKTTRIHRDEIEQMKSAQSSIMPAGLHEKLTKEQLKDLLTSLLTEPPHMPLDSPLKAPPIRTPSEVAAVLAGSETTTTPMRDLKIVLVAGQKDHGLGEHDYPAWQVRWGQLLMAVENTDIELAWDFPSDEQMNRADVLVFFQKGAWTDARQAALDAYQSRGGGAVYIHWAVNGDDRVSDFSKRIGLASQGGNIRFRHGPLQLEMHNTDHPIMRNIDQLSLYDESYWLLTGNPKDVTLLATSVEDDVAQPQMWTYERGRGRVFVSIPGHYSWTFDDPIFRTLLLRGIAWSAREPVDRFNDLVPLGSRMSR